MNSTAEQAWSQAPEHPLDAMTMSNDLNDVENFLDFSDINLDNFPSVDPAEYGEHIQHPHGTHPNSPFDEMSEPHPPSSTSTQDFGGHEQFGMPHNVEQRQQQHQQQQQPQSQQYNRRQAPTSHPFTNESMYQPSMRPGYLPGHPQQFHYQQQQGFPPGNHIPPTPNSFEMHGEAGRFMHQQIDPQQRAILEQRYQLRKDDAIAFTPMVSPAGTPQYNVPPEFTTVAGAYFSPLTSPMLHAQNAHNTHHRQQHRQGYYTNPSTAPSSSATSPVDPSIDVDMIGDGIFSEAVNSHARRPRRKVATPRSAGPSIKMRHSPILKPQKRKPGTLPSVVPAKEAENLVVETQRSGKPQPGSAGMQLPAPFNGSSEDGSISPEPLSEALMGPPPRPGSSLTQSPAMTAQQKGANASAVGHAATPKSLLSMRDDQQTMNGQPTTAQTDQVVEETGGIDDLQLPDAASPQAPRLSLSQINTQIPLPAMDDHTPRLSARKTPKLGPLSTPASARPTSAMASPSMTGSPMSGITPANFLKDRKPDMKGGRGNKKRGSTGANGSTLVSPALRPRISPSIKPLLPEGTALHSPTHALLLASKSNYQNLLEGNHLPGVNYPDSLSTGLTTKRTSHKVAEQGRRNRINEALKEMQSLVPRSSQKGAKDSNSDDSPEAGAGADGDSKDGKDDGQGKSHSSKAATVEMANVYIKDMQRKEQETNAELARLKRENEEMRRKLGEHVTATMSTERGSSSAVDSASPASVKVQ